MSYHTKLTTLVLMFNSTELFCIIDDFFLKFEATYWKFLKQC
ncbi:IS982 family transposase, partial [Acinetobacter terrestris]